MENLEPLILKIIDLPNYGVVFKIKIFFIGLSVIFALLIIYFLFFKTAWLKFLLLYDIEEVATFKPAGARKKDKNWIKIIKRLDSGLESEYKISVIEADNLLSKILQNMGFGGATLEEQLGKLTSATLPSIEEVREIHNVRNRIVREPDFKLSEDDVRKTLAVYEKALTDLHVL